MPLTLIHRKHSSPIFLVLVLLVIGQAPPATTTCPYDLSRPSRSLTSTSVSITVDTSTGSSTENKSIDLCLANEGQVCIPNDFNWVDNTTGKLKSDGENVKLLEYLNEKLIGSNVSIPLFPLFKRHGNIKNESNQPLKKFQMLELEFMSLFCASSLCEFAEVKPGDEPDKYECSKETTSKGVLNFAAIRKKLYDLLENVMVVDGNCSYISKTRSKAEFEESEAEIEWSEGAKTSRIVLCKVKDGYGCYPLNQAEANNAEEHLRNQQKGPKSTGKVRRAARYTREVLYGGPEFLSWNCRSGVCNIKSKTCAAANPPVNRIYKPWYLGESGSARSKPRSPVSEWCFVLTIFIFLGII